MSVLKSNLVKKTVSGRVFSVPKQESDGLSEIKKVIREKNYLTNGEILLVIKDIDVCNLTLNSETTEHIIIKALTKVIIKPSQNLIDEFYNEIQIDKGACVEFFLLENNWYIVSSDGLKLE